MTYYELCKSIGIDREAITKACAEPANTAIGKEPHFFKQNIGDRVKPPDEDLSRFVSKTTRQISKKLRSKKRV